MLAGVHRPAGETLRVLLRGSAPSHLPHVLMPSIWSGSARKEPPRAQSAGQEEQAGQDRVGDAHGVITTVSSGGMNLTIGGLFGGSMP